MKGKLYLVSTPIGNIEDITLRALSVLKSSDFIICEEYREARRFLSQYKIDKELISLNEHNERETAPDIMLRLMDGKNASLISDAGTPLFSDPGSYLVELCIQNEIKIIPVPGANSLLPALIGSGFSTERFYYYGWLSPKKDVRRQQLQKLKNVREVLVFMDTPYRLQSLMDDIIRVMGSNKQAVLAFQLTMPDEKFYRGTTGKIFNIAEKDKLKGEFVLVVDNTGRD
jgi:16S rRNA (cytidine1402-2'-O)-methyltransferase